MRFILQPTLAANHRIACLLLTYLYYLALSSSTASVKAINDDPDWRRVEALVSRLGAWHECKGLTELYTVSSQSLTLISNANDLQLADQKHSQQLQTCEPHFDGHVCWPAISVRTLVKTQPNDNHNDTHYNKAEAEAGAEAEAKVACPTTLSLPRSLALSPGNLSLLKKSNLQSIKQQQQQEALPSTWSSISYADTFKDSGDDATTASAKQQQTKYATRVCLPTKGSTKNNKQHVGAWQQANYATCNEPNKQKSLFDPNDEWIGQHEQRAFKRLVDELERIEPTYIDVYGNKDFLSQWTECVASFLIDETNNSSSSTDIANYNSLQQTQTNNLTAIYCPVIFDGWRCWPKTRAGQTVLASCPSLTGFSAEQKVHKICMPNGHWYRHPDTNKIWSNYTTCVDLADLGFRTRILDLYVIGNLISLVALGASLTIFVAFKSLKCTRVTIHKNLFLSFIVNNFMWIVWYTIVVRDAEMLKRNPLACRAWHVVLHYFMVSNYFWMFCEGLYLHTLLVVAFISDDKLLKWFYLLGWLCPMPIILAYVIKRAQDASYTQFCWMDESPHNLFLTVPIGISWLLNLAFLINIVRVLVTKLRANNSQDTHQTRKAVRATFILIPLLGLHYVLIPFRPEAKSEWESLYEYIGAICASFQGLCVSLLFCFCNTEVVYFLKKWIKNTFELPTSSSHATNTSNNFPTTNRKLQILSSQAVNHTPTPSSSTNYLQRVKRSMLSINQKTHAIPPTNNTNNPNNINNTNSNNTYDDDNDESSACFRKAINQNNKSTVNVYISTNNIDTNYTATSPNNQPLEQKTNATDDDNHSNHIKCC